MSEATNPLEPALKAIGRTSVDVSRHPILHGNGQSLITICRPAERGGFSYSAVWMGPSGIRFLGDPPATTAFSQGHGLTGPAAELFDRIVDSTRLYLERIEEIDTQLSDAEQKGRSVPLREIWSLQRRTALLRAQLGRTYVAVAELGGPFADKFPGLVAALPPLEAELERVQQLCANVQQALSDLILLRNAEESNRIAESANRLSATSNRIAALANISNIRMLGLTYIALLLGLVSAVVLFPNTAATILGMPSAGWVPGWWVDIALVVIAAVPFYLVFRLRWIRVILSGLPSYESRIAEGLADLPELSPEGAARPEPSQRL
ncbi:MAG: hypothetical protein L3K17_04790 [Thermoplasmata archaeon]|nr:hypothetical protein [Thermoplasmata archaeon]